MSNTTWVKLFEAKPLICSGSITEVATWPTRFIHGPDIMQEAIDTKRILKPGIFILSAHPQNSVLKLWMFTLVTVQAPTLVIQKEAE